MPRSAQQSYFDGMKTSRTFMSALLVAVMVLGGLAGEVLAMSPGPFAHGGEVWLASNGNCYAIGERYAAQQGGQLARATRETRNGQEVCVVVVLLPARDGERPRRAETVLPLN